MRLGPSACLWSIGLCACAHSLPPPTLPLVPTPEQSWRANAPPLLEQRVPISPEISSARLSNGMSVLSAVVPNAPYSVVEAVIQLTVERSQAELIAHALVHALRRDQQELPPTWSMSESSLRLSWRCEPDRIEDALRAIQVLFSGPPRAEDIDWARRSKTLRVKREPLSVLMEMKSQLQRRLGLRLGREHRVPVSGRVQGNLQAGLDAGSLYAQLFDPAAAAVVVAGTTDANAVRALAESHLGALAPRGDEHAQPAPEAPTRAEVAAFSRRVAVVRGSVSPAVLVFGFAVPGWTSPLQVDASLLAHLLGGAGVSAVLNASLREEHGLTYAVGARYEPEREAGLLWGFLAVDNEQVPAAIELLRRNFERLQFEAQQQLFTVARQNLIERLAAPAGRVQMMADLLVSQFSRGAAPWFGPEALSRLSALDAEGLRAAAREMLARPAFVVAGTTDVDAALERAHMEFDDVD